MGGRRAGLLPGALVNQPPELPDQRPADRFDVDIINTADHPFLAEHEGRQYLRDDDHRVWLNDDLQSFTPLRFMPPLCVTAAEIDEAVQLLRGVLTVAAAIAQANLQGGGEAERGRATSPLPPSATVELGDATEESHRQIEQLQETQQQLLQHHHSQQLEESRQLQWRSKKTSSRSYFFRPTSKSGCNSVKR